MKTMKLNLNSDQAQDLLGAVNATIKSLEDDGVDASSFVALRELLTREWRCQIKLKSGRVKWFRHDGTGYIIDDERPENSILVDSSVLITSLRKGQKVGFKSELVLGREVATYVVVNGGAK